MGVSTDAILFYGIEFDEDELDTDENGELIEGDFLDYLEEKLEGIDIEIGTHCSYSDPIYYLYTKRYLACRGYPERIPRNIPTKDKWDYRIKEACERLGMEYIKPEWLLCSLWDT